VNWPEEPWNLLRKASLRRSTKVPVVSYWFAAVASAVAAVSSAAAAVAAAAVAASAPGCTAVAPANGVAIVCNCTKH